MNSTSRSRWHSNYPDPLAADAMSGDNCLVAELIEAVHDLGGLDQLCADRLASLTTAAASWTGSFDDFRRQATAAWEVARPPADVDLELIEAERWDCGLIDWGADDGLDSGDDEVRWAVAS